MPGPPPAWCFTLNGLICLAILMVLMLFSFQHPSPSWSSISLFIPAIDSWYLCMFQSLLVTPKLTLITLHRRQPLLVSLGINLLHYCSWEHVRLSLPSFWPSMHRGGPRCEEWPVLRSLLFPVHGLHWIILYIWSTYLAFPTLQMLLDTVTAPVTVHFPPYIHWLIPLWIFPLHLPVSHEGTSNILTLKFTVLISAL